MSDVLHTLKSQVHLLDSDSAGANRNSIGELSKRKHHKARGCGIILGKRHVMTCTHVVFSCLGLARENPEESIDEAELLVRFPADPNFHSRIEDITRRMKVSKWWLHRDANRNLEGREFPHIGQMEKLADFDDICILELSNPSDNFPEFTQAIKPEPKGMMAGRRFQGMGLAENMQPGFHFCGQVIGQGQTRNQLTAAPLDGRDMVVTQGCSGAGVFSEHGQSLIGMITDTSQTTSAQSIPIEVLVRAWEAYQARLPQEDRVKLQGAVPVTRKFAGSSNLIQKFADNFDRKPPIEKFGDSYEAATQNMKNGMICTLAGTIDDNIDGCQRRMGLLTTDGKFMPPDDIKGLVMALPKVPEDERDKTIDEWLKVKRPAHQPDQLEQLNHAFFHLTLEEKNIDAEILSALRSIGEYLNQSNITETHIPIVLFVMLEFSKSKKSTREEMRQTYDNVIETLIYPQPKPRQLKNLFGLLHQPVNSREQAISLAETPFLDTFNITEIRMFVTETTIELGYDQKSRIKAIGLAKQALEGLPEIHWSAAGEVIEKLDQQNWSEQ